MANQTAAALAALRRRFRVLPESRAGSGELQNDGQPIMVELLIDGRWLNLTALDLVYARNPIAISYGQADEASAAQPGVCALLINNRNGAFSPRNPTSPYYGKIGRNTQIRVSVPVGFTQSVRFWGEVPAWPQDWDPSGADVWVDVQAAGVLRRLNQGGSAVRSTLYQTLTSQALAVSNPVLEYWPMEDVATATQIASANGGQPMRIYGTPTLASSTAFVASAAIPVANNARLLTNVRSYKATGQTQVRMLISWPSAGSASPDKSVIFNLTTTGTARLIELYYGTGGAIGLRSFDANGASAGDAGVIGFAVDGTSRWVSVELTESGGNILYNIDTLTQSTNAQVGFSGTLSTGFTVGQITGINLAPNGNQTGLAYGHVTLQTRTTALLAQLSSFNGFTGESAGTRALRLISDLGVASSFIGGFGSVAMGAQTPNTVLALLTECCVADGSALYERWDAFGLGLLERSSFYNAPVVAALDYVQAHLSVVPKPLDDDRFTKNTITVTRTGGSSATATQQAGVLSVLPPPAGVSPYPDTPTINIATDATLQDQAGWRLWVGTQDAARYPVIAVNLARAPFVASPALRAAILNVRPGSRIQILNPPVWMGVGPVDLLVIGGAEVVDTFQHELHFTCVPWAPYQIAVLDDAVLGRADTDGSTLVADAPPTATSLTVATTSAAGRMWTTLQSDFPFDIAVGGERITVTSISTNIGGSDGTFESGVSGWTPSNGTFAQSSVQAHSGTFAGLLTVVGSPSGTFVRSSSFPVVAGTSYVLKQWVFAASGSPGSVVAAIDWYDVNGSYLSTTATAGVAVAAAWQQQTITGVAPAGALTAVVGPTIGGSPAAGTAIYLDDVTFQPVAGPQLFSVTRSVNGVAKTQLAGADVRLFTPPVMSL